MNDFSMRAARSEKRWKSRFYRLKHSLPHPAARKKGSYPKPVSTRMELAVHRLRETKLPRAESLDRNKIKRRLREVQARRSELNDLFEVAVQKYIATDRG